MQKKTLADQIADLELTAPKDYDPEDLVEPLNDDSAKASDHDEDIAREHYVSVGKSTLRNQQFVLDDPRYAGQRISRNDIYSSDENEEWEEPDKDSEEEDDDDESNAEASDDDVDNASLEDDVAEASEDEDNTIKSELRKIEEEEKAVIAQMSKSTQADVEKGQHVRHQLALWDQILGIRIHTQKMVESANRLPSYDTWDNVLSSEQNYQDDLKGAKETVRQAIDQLLTLRQSLFEDFGSVKVSDKGRRKRPYRSDDDYLDALWNDISDMNKVYTPIRRSTLEKWSNKVQISAGARLNKKFKAFDQNILSQMDAVMADKENLVKRTQLKRADYTILGKQSAAPTDTDAAADQHLNQYDAEIFDDNDFYQQQLRELIDSRMVDSDNVAADVRQWVAGKTDDLKKKKKTREHSKGTKGRMLRYDVHELLENFMAPIPAGHWHGEMTDELFSSLLGQKSANLLHQDTTTSA